mmetsp:Transcript_31435/g.30785  ORF Transcript_31435/g.30785 Transcript_31435/m.30785 type:complete len:100 (+) Transcript_31435:526-825(+)
MQRSLKAISRSADKEYDSHHVHVDHLIRANDWKRTMPNKLKIQNEMDKADNIGYIIADSTKSKKSLKFTIDPTTFPLTTKYKKRRFLNDSKASLPPLPV